MITLDNRYQSTMNAAIEIHNEHSFRKQYHSRTGIPYCNSIYCTEKAKETIRYVQIEFHLNVS